MIKAQQNKIIPSFRMCEQQLLALNDFDKCGQLKPKINRDDDEKMSCDDDSENESKEDQPMSRLVRVDIIYNSGQTLCTGWGNTKHAAERNASINGLEWLKQTYDKNNSENINAKKQAP